MFTHAWSSICLSYRQTFVKYIVTVLIVIDNDSSDQPYTVLSITFQRLMLVDFLYFMQFKLKSTKSFDASAIRKKSKKKKPKHYTIDHTYFFINMCFSSNNASKEYTSEVNKCNFCWPRYDVMAYIWLSNHILFNKIPSLGRWQMERSRKPHWLEYCK